MIFWRRIASSSRNWPPEGSSRPTSSRGQKKPVRAMVWSKTDSLFLKGPASGDDRIRFVGSNAQVLDGFVEDGTLDLAVHEKLMQSGHGDEAGVDLEKVAQRSAPFAASEAIGAERRQAMRHPFADHIR